MNIKQFIKGNETPLHEHPEFTEYKKENYPGDFEFMTIKCGEPIELCI